MKSTVDEIRQRFDQDVERFSNLETGQTAMVDSPLAMELVSSAAAAVCPYARDLLDIGCGAGNYTLKVIEKLEACRAADTSPRGSPAEKIALNCFLLDLSKPMLDRAVQRVSLRTLGKVQPIRADMRDVPLDANSLDIVVTASALHHLRGDADWENVFAKIFRALRPGGCFWIFDMILHASPAIEKLIWNRYGDYLEALKGGGETGKKYREHVFAYVEAEDTPRPLMYQIDLLRRVGFTAIDVLHKNVIGAVFGGMKPPG